MLAILTGGSAWLLYAGIDPVEEREALYRPPVRHELLADVKTWRRVSDVRSADALSASQEDLVVVDPQVLGNGRAAQGERLAKLKVKPDGGRRLVLAAVAVGRAETTAPFWKPAWTKTSSEGLPSTSGHTTVLGPTPAHAGSPQSARIQTAALAAADEAPAWLGDEDPSQKGAYAVRYWDPEWKAQLFGRDESQIEQLLALGFDGVMLAKADAYRAWSEKRPDAVPRMIELIGAAVAHAKVRNPDAIIALESGDELLESRTIRAAIDLVVKEDLLYGGDGLDRPRLTHEVTESIARLRKAHADGVPVLVVERLSADSARIAARRTLESYMFVPDVIAGPRTGRSP